MSTTSIHRHTGRVRRGVHRVAHVLAFVAVLCLVFMVALTVADVVRRTTEGRSVTGVTELSEVMMAVIVFLSLAYAERRGAHVSMTLVRDRLGPRASAILNGLGLAVMIVILGWMVLVTAERAWEAFVEQEFRYGLVRIPVWPARVAIAVGLAAYFVELCFRLYDDARQAWHGVPVSEDGSPAGPVKVSQLT